MSLGGLGEFSSAVSANQTIRNGAENLDWDERCFAYVKEEFGLDVCHQNKTNPNKARIDAFIKEIQNNGSCPEFTAFTGCTQYNFPTWLDPMVKFLWFLFACQIIICCMWMYYFWTNITYRQSIFRFKHEGKMRKSQSQDSLDLVGDGIDGTNLPPVPNGEDIVIENSNSNSTVTPSKSVSNSTSLPTVKQLSAPLQPLKPLAAPLKGTFLPPDVDDTDKYKLRKFLFQDTINPDDVIFGHKIFHLPTFRFEWLRKIDQKISPRARILLSFLIIYSSLLALVGDFFIDVYFLHGLSTDTLIDVKNIHFEKGALIAMVFFEFTAFFCLPITAFVFYKMSWSRNLQTNLIGEVIIISLQYLMEDGPELMLQYYFVDKYAGTNYDYPDGTTFSGRAIVVFSSFASLTVAIIGLANLASLYHEVQFWLTLRAVRTYLEDENTEWNKFEIRRLPSIVWELNKQAEEDFLVERSRHDIHRIEKRCRIIAMEANKREKHKGRRKPVKMKTFRTQLRNIRSFREDRIDNQALIDSIKQKNNVITKFKVLRICMLIIGLIPFIVNLCRLGAAVYQIFIFRKYNTGCLKYVVNEENRNQTIISQPSMRHIECWDWVEWPFFLLNFLGLLIHTSLLIGIGIGKLTETSFHKEMIEVEDSDESDSEQENESSQETGPGLHVYNIVPQRDIDLEDGTDGSQRLSTTSKFVKRKNRIKRDIPTNEDKNSIS